ncbi:MAG: hypothetical protein ABIH23_05995, partial [bacterium]
PTAGALEIGRYSTQYMNGQLSNARIFNRALAATEVEELYRHPWSGIWVPSGRTYFGYGNYFVQSITGAIG